MSESSEDERTIKHVRLLAATRELRKIHSISRGYTVN